MKASTIAASAMLSAMALPVAAHGQDRVVVPSEFKPEECYGIANGRQNDCQTLTHSCARMATEDKDGTSWIYLPAGTCDKIVGGSRKPKA